MTSASKAAPATSIDLSNVALFDAEATDWWNPRGSSALLHAVNPARLRYLRTATAAHFGVDPRERRWLASKRVLDIGCGGGILCEPMARLGAKVMGLDASERAIAVARARAELSGLEINYCTGSAESVAEAGGKTFDIVTAMEVIEHVADRSAFLGALRALVHPSGLLVFSTPNRTAASFATLIVGAEHLVRLIPRGAHNWRQFLRPDELEAEMAAAGFKIANVRGIGWRPAKGFELGSDLSINYIGSATPIS